MQSNQIISNQVTCTTILYETIIINKKTSITRRSEHRTQRRTDPVQWEWWYQPTRLNWWCLRRGYLLLLSMTASINIFLRYMPIPTLICSKLHYQKIASLLDLFCYLQYVFWECVFSERITIKKCPFLYRLRDSQLLIRDTLDYFSVPYWYNSLVYQHLRRREVNNVWNLGVLHQWP